jgi:hypothetical protein
VVHSPAELYLTVTLAGHSHSGPLATALTLAGVPYLVSKLDRLHAQHHLSVRSPAVVPTHTSSLGYLRSSQAAGA